MFFFFYLLFRLRVGLNYGGFIFVDWRMLLFFVDYDFASSFLFEIIFGVS